MEVFCAWRTDRIDGLLATMMMTANEPEITKTSQLLNKASKDVGEWAMSVFGHVVLDGVWMGLFAVPADKLTELAAIRDRYQSFTNHTISMGLGMSIDEAQHALEHSIQNGGDQLTFWTDELGEDQEPGDEPENDISGLLSKAEPEGAEESASASESKPGAKTEASTPTDSQPKAPEAAEQPTQDPRTQIMAALKEIKAAAPAIEALKERNPQAYQAVKHTVDAMITMAQSVMQKSEKKSKKEELSPGETPDEESSTLDKDELEAQKRGMPGGLATAGDVSGTTKDGKIKTAPIDPLTGSPTGKTKWYSVKSGMVTGNKSGVAVSSLRQKDQ